MKFKINTPKSLICEYNWDTNYWKYAWPRYIYSLFSACIDYINWIWFFRWPPSPHCIMNLSIQLQKLYLHAEGLTRCKYSSINRVWERFYSDNPTLVLLVRCFLKHDLVPFDYYILFATGRFLVKPEKLQFYNSSLKILNRP